MPLPALPSARHRNYIKDKKQRDIFSDDIFPGTGFCSSCFYKDDENIQTRKKGIPHPECSTTA
jgi:hypothetical protein